MNRHIPYPIAPLSSTNPATARNLLSIRDSFGTTPLAHRRFETLSNLRVLILGDSIAPGILFADTVGVLRLLQSYIGNAGGGGASTNEAYWKVGGSATFSSVGWFRNYASVPAASDVEWSANFSVRVPGDTATVLWRAPAGGTATFKIQTCTDADGVGVGTWVDQGGIRTADSGEANETIESATISIAVGNYRLRVLGVTGTVQVVGLELSTSTTGGCVILNYAEDGSELSSWAALTDTQRTRFIDAVDPDVVMVLLKDPPASLEDSLPYLSNALAASLSDGYPRDLVALAPFPTVNDNDPLGNDNGKEIYRQREVVRKWANDTRATFIDLWELSPVYDIFFSDNVHLATAYEHAHMAHMVMERLGWLRYRTVEARNFQIGIHTSNGVAFGVGSNGSTSGAALGVSANGATEGAAVGRSANGSDHGSAVGWTSNGSYYGSALGYLTDAHDQGVSVGLLSVGHTQGVAVGRSTSGHTHGVSVGNASSGNTYGIAIGTGAQGSGGGVAIGFGFDSRGAGNIDRCRAEIGVRTAAGGGTPACRVSMQANGRIQFSLPQTDSAPTDSGATFDTFQNADGTIPRGMYGWQVNAAGNALILYVNVGGTIKTASIALT